MNGSNVFFIYLCIVYCLNRFAEEHIETILYIEAPAVAWILL